MAMTTAPPSLQRDVQSAGQASVIGSGLMKEPERRWQWPEDLFNEVHQSGPKDKYDDYSSIASLMIHPQLGNSTQQRAFPDLLMRKLKFPGMGERQKQILDASESTFEWAYSRPSSGSNQRLGFLDWLESDLPQFWILGRAGCGKSSLIKSLAQNARTKDTLRTWASPKSLLTASFYFGDSGTAVQNSKVGLLKSILHDIIFQCPELATSIFPAHCQGFDMLSIELRDSWSYAELKQAFKRMVDESASNHKFCFFIDGIDVLRRDSRDLVDFLTNLCSPSCDLKICLSSRPLDVIEVTFGRGPKLVLHEQSAPGISQWIDLELSKSPSFAALEVRNPGHTAQLKGNIVKKSSGVFLLAELMMRSLLVGLLYGDRISDLQRRLDTLPGNLEDLLEQILNSLDVLYMEHACRLLQLVHAAIPLPTLLSISFADEESSTYYVECEPTHLAAEEFASRAEAMMRRIRSRCKGLLHFTHYQSATNPTDSLLDCRVVYLHRAVKDFLQRRDIRERIRVAAGPSFNPNEALFKSCIVQLKVLPQQHLLPDSFWDLVGLALEYFIRAQNQLTSPVTELLDELDRAATMWFLQTTSSGETLMQAYWRTEGPLSYHWTSTLTIDWKRGVGGLAANPFLSFAVRCQLHSYVEAKLSDESCATISALLYTAVDEYCINISNAPSCVWNRPSHRMIELLLGKGADPNKPLGRTSPWDRVIEQYPPKNSDDRELWEDVIRVFLQYGAELEKAPHLRHLKSKRPRPPSQPSPAPPKNPIERLISQQKDASKYVSPYKSIDTTFSLKFASSSRAVRAAQRLSNPPNTPPTYISPYPPLDPVHMDAATHNSNDGEILIADFSTSRPRIIQISTSVTSTSSDAISTEAKAAAASTAEVVPADPKGSIGNGSNNAVQSPPKVKKAIRVRRRPAGERKLGAENKYWDKRKENN